MAGDLPISSQAFPLAIMKSEYIGKARPEGRNDRMEMSTIQQSGYDVTVKTINSNHSHEEQSHRQQKQMSQTIRLTSICLLLT